MNNETIKTPMHLWIVGVSATLWNLLGAWDYTQTQFRNPEHLAAAGFGPEDIAYLDALPAWADAVWAFGVWGGVMGSVMLLIRCRFAFHAYAVSFIGVTISTISRLIMPQPPAMEGVGHMIFMLVIWAVAGGLLYYAARQRKGGLLR